MIVPDSANEFCEKVFRESRRLVALGIWELSVSKLDGWLLQFRSSEERFFAASILHELILRSPNQFDAALRALFRGQAANEAVAEPVDDLQLVKCLQARKPGDIRLIPVIRNSDPPTKSGPLILRLLKRALNLNTAAMCWPWAIKHGSDNSKIKVIFVDDFLGSGKQFVDFFTQWEFSDLDGDIEYIYAPVVAHQQGLEHIAEALPRVKTIFAEKLEIDDGFFSEKKWNRLTGGKTTGDAAKSWYIEFAKSHEITPRSTGILGVGDLALTLGFAHGTPNNSLPILWYNGNNWKPLLER